MEILLAGVNWLAVGVSTIICYMLAGLWYSPKLFDNRWAEGVGMENGGEAGDKELAASVRVTEPEPVKQSFEYNFEKYYESGIWMGKVKAPEAPKQPLPPTPSVDANAVKDPMVNANVMQTGLTPTEQALLSNEEQVMRLRQRGIARA